MIDILFDDGTDDLVIQGGDLLLGDATRQHQADVIVAGKAWYHHAPGLGADINRQLLTQPGANGVMGTIRTELFRDGLPTEGLRLTGTGEIVIET
jgi:hypothetical protein